MSGGKLAVPTALVTGITGQDGGYLAEQLVRDGWLVHGAVRPGEATPSHLVSLGDAVTCTPVDLLDSAAMAALLELANPDEVYNFAGISSVAQSWREPVLTTRVNGEAVAILLDLIWGRMGSGKEVKFLQASSAEIFAGSQSSPQNESTPLSPQNPYGAAKAYAHQLVQVYRARGLFAVNAILYNHESPRRPISFVTRKISATVAAIAEGRDAQLILGALDSRRDWGWAPEYVEGMTRALRHQTPEDFVFATGVSASVADFAALAFEHVGIPDWRRWCYVDNALYRAGDAPELIGDSRRVKEELGWQPKVALPEIVARMVDADRACLATRAT